MKNRHGFTLVELLVVIAIIAILAAVVVLNAFKASEKAKISATLEDLKNFRTAALMFYTDTGVFPADIGEGMDPGFLKDTAYWNSGNIRKVFDVDPSDSVNSAKYRELIKKKWGGPYLDKSLDYPNQWGGLYDYECWTWPGVEGVWVTIHQMPDDLAWKLVEKSPYEVLKGEPYPDNIGDKTLKRVSLRVARFEEKN